MDTLDIANAPPYLAELNAAQRAAATFGIGAAHGDAQTGTAAPLLIIAGAGTGKTRTLTHRVAHLVLNGADPRRILLMTFARRMAAQMTKRVEHICALALSGRMAGAHIAWSGTFHAIGARLLRMHAESIGLNPSFSILDRGDAEDLVDLVRDDLGLAKSRKRFPKKSTCLAIYSYAVNAQTPLKQTLKHAFPWCAEWEDALTQLFGAYVEAKQAQGALDYDDLLLYWAKMMEHPALAATVARRFDHVLVDEYQDTNALQAAVLLGLKPDGRGLTVVGDDAQAIYSFRSATVRNILDFPALFDPPAHTTRLEQNYRSTQVILDACNAVIGRASEGYAKELFSSRSEPNKPVIAMVADEAAQVDFIVARILANREAGMELRDQAVLMRASHHSGELEIELTRRNIPFVKFGGLKFLEAAHVKDVLAILRWAENPRDQVAALRVLKLMPGVGPAAARRALGHMNGSVGNFSALATFTPPAAARDFWSALVDLMKELCAAKEWKAEIERLRLWYDPLLALRYDSPHTRLGDLDQLERIATQHPSRVAFLTDLALDPPEAAGAEAGPPLKDEDWLILSTIHSAKGQEWRAVYVLNVVDGCIPSDLATDTSAEIEEERRLLYVAMTRARDDLVLMQPLRYYVRGQRAGSDRHIYAPRSRFIASEDIDRFEIMTAAMRPTSGDIAEIVEPVDLKAAMRRMWPRM
ncbi:MAG: ATP-dependent helicase [Betaproteobacteria bacterium]|nr:ATP-dependent helicase [Betaproteobacteria bacterium]